MGWSHAPTGPCQEQGEAPVPTGSSHHRGTYWNKRVTQPTPRGISCKREEKSWIWLLCRAPQAPAARAPHSPHSPAWLKHLEAPVAQCNLPGRQRLPHAHLHALESWGAGRHGGTGLHVRGRTGASAPREPGSHREKGQGCQSGDVTALEGWDTEHRDRDRSS